ncbi:hypothetical protein BHE74_00018858 [Ensete ventricosum]|uniref:Uncharacterized protein n=1 Tax=Ensete ventricosum TaxID=4639 RepID=A0A444GAW0_ENSVE|nr:hypothetical protein GW17_00003348 [Ensete ventricosum]RWW73283.1 hypothetical protein BHE74_00018858 [Ensete ventricosum]RZR75066.1 hypothetical protein BHM03_00048845 [Ensete ventricosum]
MGAEVIGASTRPSSPFDRTGRGGFPLRWLPSRFPEEQQESPANKNLVRIDSDPHSVSSFLSLSLSREVQPPVLPRGARVPTRNLDRFSRGGRLSLTSSLLIRRNPRSSDVSRNSVPETLEDPTFRPIWLWSQAKLNPSSSP